MQISILGCGWLGFPLGKALVKKGFRVKGSTTTEAKLEMLNSAGIKAYQVAVSAEGIDGPVEDFLAGTDVLVINIPPGPGIDFTGSISRLASEIEKSGVKNVLCVSATSVYKESSTFPVYKESDAPNATSVRGKQLIFAERLLQANVHFQTCVLRFGGLIGAGRNPVTFLAGKREVANPLAPVNLIHQHDCIRIITTILENEDFSQVYNAVFPEHPQRKKYYFRKAEVKGLPPPHFRTNGTSEGKIIASVALQERLGFQFERKIW